MEVLRTVVAFLSGSTVRNHVSTKTFPAIDTAWMRVT